MDKLEQCITKSKLYRSVWNGEKGKKEIAFVYSKNNSEKALTWFTINFGKQPDYIISEELDSTNDNIHPNIKNLQKKSKNTTIIVYGKNARRVSIILAICGVTEFYFAEDPNFKSIKDDRNYLLNHKRELTKLFDLLSDDESRLTLASVVKHRVTGDHGYLRMAQYVEYEHPIVSADAEEWVADCGAANGATSFRFARRVGANGVVFAFEPDPRNVAIIASAMPKQPKNSGKIIIVRAAVSDSPGLLRFMSGNGGSSRLSSDGDIQVPVRTIDDVAAEHRIKGPGLISLDVEGFEKQALTGGMKTIKKLRPKLQVSIYHKRHDLFSLPLWLNDQLDDYKFFMGHHDSYHCETDLYAIPAEMVPA